MSNHGAPPAAVVLVDEHDTPVGTMEKLEAHRAGLLHRAFSVFILNQNGEVLLQRRSDSKYHSAGLWTNTCCSHPRPGENTRLAAERRLEEEMGMVCTLGFGFSFLYRADVGNQLIEHELDHVYFGRSNGPARPDPQEVAEVRWAGVDEITASLIQEPERYTAWLSICWSRVRELLVSPGAAF